MEGDSRASGPAGGNEMTRNSRTSAERTGSDAAIDIDGLSFTYPDGTEAVTDVSLSVPEGEFFGFLGPNGAGKTTAIKTIATLLRPTSGRVEVFGRDVETESHAVRERIGYMAQETSIDPHLTARENVEFAAEMHHVPRGKRNDRIDELLDLVGLADVADKRAGAFSGGMKKRLDAATALVHDPPLVFLDEPTTGLDPRARNRLHEYFRKISDRGTTVFLTTQYLEEADELADRIGIIADGDIVATGSPADLKATVGGNVLEIVTEDASESAREHARAVVADAGILHDDESVTVTDDGITVASPRASELSPDVLGLLHDASVRVRSLHMRSPTLDEVFLAITGERLQEGEPADSPTLSAAADQPTPGVD